MPQTSRETHTHPPTAAAGSPQPRGRAAHCPEGRFVGRFATTGTVYLVGAGPGATDLITVRGLRILQSADVVLHDALISPEMLLEAAPDAEVVSVGKRGYCVGSTRQEHINEAMVRYARMGKSVCRLKCGDPCVFGRGGEEAEMLVHAGVPFQIVPGVTSAVGVCAAAGIPLTHRDAGQAVALVTGHHDPDSSDCTLDWNSLARMPAVVFYMAVRHVTKIAARLSSSGLSPDTPVAVIESGTLIRQRVHVATLGTIGVVTECAAVTGPAVFVVGEIVRFRDKLMALASGGLESAVPLVNENRGLAPTARRKSQGVST
ncbi:MAG: uroporphyrinogen-III C-methyltransferase [Planctomycetaceae bacterium]|nr:uroporphyrinogen-III C-methyltransferase [Planctomycetaceae bacterium]